jgi:hypothetical protein
MERSAGRARIAWPAGRIMVASAAPGTHQPAPAALTGTRGERRGRVVSAQSADGATPDGGLDRDGVPVAVGEEPVVKGAVSVAKLQDDLRRAPRLDDDADAVGAAGVAEPSPEVRVVGEVELAAADLAVSGEVPAASGVVRGSLGGGAEMGAGDGDLRRGRA